MLIMVQFDDHTEYIIFRLFIPGFFYFFRTASLCDPVGITGCAKNIYLQSGWFYQLRNPVR